MKQNLKEVITTTADAIVATVKVGKEIVDLTGVFIDDLLLDELKSKAQNMNKEQLKSYLARRRLLEFYGELEPYCKE